MRLIDADKLTELCDIMADKCDGIGASVWYQFRTTVEWSPSVDAVQVVRCKDCKEWDIEYNTDTTFHFCYIFGIRTNEDCFCAEGTRKDGEDNG